MKQKFSDKDIFNLLSNIGNAENAYPSEMMQSRREMYVKQAAAMAILSNKTGNGTDAGGNGNAPASNHTGTGSAHTLGTFFEAALMITIALEAGVAAYIYRDNIADFVTSTIFPRVEIAANPTENFSSTPALVPITGGETMTETPIVTFTTTPSVTATGTPTSLLVEPGNDNNGGQVTEPVLPANDPSNREIMSTPSPKDNPGNHYGNTPKPERTKDASKTPSNDKNKSNKD